MEDEAYVHLLLRVAGPATWRTKGLTLGLDVRPGGNRGLPGLPGAAPEADAAVRIGPGPRAELLQAAWTDPVAFRYGLALPYLAVDPRDLEPSGAWVRPRLMLNRPTVVPSTGEQRPAEVADLGTLPFGTANPRDRGHDARMLAAARGSTVELRLLWALFGYADPSSHCVLVPRADGGFGTLRSSRIGMTVASPGAPLVRLGAFTWRSWNAVESHERRKAGWPALRGAFAATSARP